MLQFAFLSQFYTEPKHNSDFKLQNSGVMFEFNLYSTFILTTLIRKQTQTLKYIYYFIWGSIQKNQTDHIVQREGEQESEILDSETKQKPPLVLQVNRKRPITVACDK